MSSNLEKAFEDQMDEVDIEAVRTGHDPRRTQKVGLDRVTRRLLTWGVETRGMQ